MQYPCIVYEVDRMAAKYANNAVYLNKVGYQGKLITRNPDDAVLMKLLGLPLCRFVRHFITDNLHHYVFTIYS